jgi:hypothetical protein
MKKLLLLLISLLLSVTVFSQTIGKDFLQNSKPTKETIQVLKSKSFKDMDKKEQEQYLQTLTKKQPTTPEKSALVMKQCLDSIVYPQSYKEMFSYDNRGNNTLYVSYNFDESENEWIGSVKREYTFDAKNNCTRIIYYGWDYNAKDWFIFFKEEFAYDDKGNMIMLAQYAEWENYKAEYEYDDKGNETVILRYDWDYDNNDWILLFRGESTYDDYDNLILYTDYEWINNQWVAYYKIEKTFNNNKKATLWIIYEMIDDVWTKSLKGEATYDTHGNETLYVESIWNGENWIDILKNKTEYEYDLVGNITVHTVYNWEENNWVISTKSIYEYDDFGNVTMSASYGWDPDFQELVGWEKYDYFYTEGNLSSMISCFWENNSWNNSNKYDYEYDSAGNMTQYISYNWENNTWIKFDKYEYSFDLNYFRPYLVVPSDYYYKYKKLEEKNYSWDGTDWAENNVVTNYWSERDIIGGISDKPAQNTTLIIYPNPATTEINVKLATQQIAEYSIFNISGQKMMQGQVQDGSTIDIQSLSPGIYFLRVENETAKIVKW